MTKMSKIAFFNKAMNLVRRHGEVVIYFKNEAGYMRRRKIRSNGKCFVSHIGFYSERWDRYQMSCFITHLGKITVAKCFKEMIKHDKYMDIKPLMIQWGKGKNMRRIEYGRR